MLERRYRTGSLPTRAPFFRIDFMDQTLAQPLGVNIVQWGLGFSLRLIAFLVNSTSPSKDSGAAGALRTAPAAPRPEKAPTTAAARGWAIAAPLTVGATQQPATGGRALGKARGGLPGQGWLLRSILPETG